MHALFAILVFMTALVILVVLFLTCCVVWTISMIGRVIRSLMRPRSAGSPRSEQRCARMGCQSDNPPRARFCRRCGQPLGAEASTRLYLGPPRQGPQRVAV